MSNIRNILPKEIDDLSLLKGIANRDNRVILQLYKLHYPYVERMILNNNGSKDQAKDVFQEAVMVLYDKVTGQGFVLESKLKTFLYAVSRRLWLKQLGKKSNNHYSIEQDGFEESPDLSEDLQMHEDQERQFEKMESALQVLGEPCQSILTDFYLRNKSMQDICEKFGYTNTDNTKTQKYKCLQRLKKLFFSGNPHGA
ncbi:RNA polymerase sigma factor [Sphingobacterium corticibacter]|nr:sigma-70 family RNA polymerase sigma factor [Sphingobacterium corticibacter]